MSLIVPKPQVTDDAQSSFNNKAGQSIQQNQHSRGTDTLLKQGTGGTRIALNASHKQHPFTLHYNPFDSEWNPTLGYGYGHVVQVQSSSYTDYNGGSHTPTMGSWVCVQKVPNLRTSDLASVNPDLAALDPTLIRAGGVNYDPMPASGYWQQIGGSGAGSSKLYFLLAQTGSYLMCYPSGSYSPYDLDGSGSKAVFIAKEYKHRSNLTTEYTDGWHTYTYEFDPDTDTGLDDNSLNLIRHDYFGDNEDQRFVPPYTFGEIISAIPEPTGLMAQPLNNDWTNATGSASASITLRIDGRSSLWAKKEPL